MDSIEPKYLHTSFAITFTYFLEQIFNKILYTVWSVEGENWHYNPTWTYGPLFVKP